MEKRGRKIRINDLVPMCMCVCVCKKNETQKSYKDKLNNKQCIYNTIINDI